MTLHLARAIHAANTTPPIQPSRSQIQFVEDRDERPGQEAPKLAQNTRKSESDLIQHEWDAWRARRNAVIHSVDVSSKFSALAEKNVRGFRRGIYAGDVDFYVGPVEKWIAEQKERRAKPAGLFGKTSVEPFLSHVILDMPSAHLRIPHVAPILKRDGFLVVFMPSITQIGDCVKIIRKFRLPFVQDRVVELGTGISGGRQWDVRLAVKKSGADPSSWTATSETGESDLAAKSDDTPLAASEGAVDVPTSGPISEEEMVMVCRPKVGVRTVGGGFIGVWRRIEDWPSQ